MAEIVLGVGTSHTPMLSTPPDQWGQRVVADKRVPGHPFRGKEYSFDELVALRKGENLADHLTMDVWEARYQASQDAIAALAAKYEEVKPDVAVIFGNDQHEMFLESNMPAFAVYWGDEVETSPLTPEQRAKLPPGIEVAMSGYVRDEPATMPCHAGLGRHLIDSLIEQEFDVGQSNALPSGVSNSWTGVPHAYGFVYRRIMGDKVIPHVPVLINTYYPPNQPTVARCYKLGQAVRRAIEDWDSDLKVAVICSGGLSHFAIDEPLDQRFLAAMKARDIEAILDLPNAEYQSGTSETKNWVPMAGVFGNNGAEMTLVDYIPCYRSEAGTGTAVAFAYWQ